MDTIGLIIFTIISYSGLSFTAKWLASIPIFSPPDFLPPIVDPRVDKTVIPKEFMGIILKGQWWIVFGYLGGLFLNIFGEEFWWRGIYPSTARGSHGQKHLDCSWHTMDTVLCFLEMELIMLLPVCLSISL